ncbi:aromatic ring-hydroxylating dioxygenase subunit alpha [Gracilibacillus alcaliphilus]|uniref:aromatic ring-hydroxylating dioxygenase subunit alpha n=1 Tax=Gracilibacillus alcaliphilus TaxID=1401441 RepID=UPI00195D491A|nr:aromatic ring-hydroxylating dioxygenase subunit alpha [Gracilibacillus alcaliphilus]MBM7675979.1 phenylpropionate dioxygenase-like ring-hydroxylating dioxygenase large terminal subunit [Gracilibacillus alcaliphilus]
MRLTEKILENDWIVACPAEEVQEEPIQVVILNERVVIFRTDNGVQAFKDLCIHRGAALSLGTVKDNCLVCPYHGWKYDETGDCVEIPQLPEDRAIPTKAKAIKYACKEAYGLIWVNFNNNAPELFDYPEYDDPNYRNIVWGGHVVDAKPPRIIENFLDVGHLAVLHGGYLGDEEHTEIQPYKMNNQEDGSIFSDEIPIFQPDPDGSGVAKDVYYTYGIYRPLAVRFTKRDPDTDHKFTILLLVRPIDENSSMVYGIMSFNYDNQQTDQETKDFQDIIFMQDKPIVENQKPEDLPLDLQVELSLISDRVSIAYRRYLTDKGFTLGTA